MRLGFSNLIANSIDELQLNELYSLSDCIDWAPTITAPKWNLLTKDGTAAFQLPTKVSAIQSLFFGIPNVHFMQEREGFIALKTHLQYLIKVSRAYNIKYILWGSPGTRQNALASFDDEVMLSRLSELLSLFKNENVEFMVEAVSPKFGCEFVNNSVELISLYKRMNSSKFSLHLDTGQMIDEGLDVLSVIENNLEHLKHLHLSEPDFGYSGSYTSLFNEIVSMLKTKNVDVVYEIQTLKADMYDKFINEFSNISTL